MAFAKINLDIPEIAMESYLWDTLYMGAID
ncbi:hypothetical protein VN12_03005 [Pirellula sp. SH-Sr6A]|nr:hypothetical protein VN12_03005 [Pirellula sp. SH-Sr6A]